MASFSGRFCHSLMEIGAVEVYFRLLNAIIHDKVTFYSQISEKKIESHAHWLESSLLTAIYDVSMNIYSSKNIFGN